MYLYISRSRGLSSVATEERRHIFDLAKESLVDASHSAVARNEEILTAAKDAPSRFIDLPRIEETDIGLRVDAFLRQKYQLINDEDVEDLSPIPIASLHKWARLKLLRLRVASQADEQAAPNKADLGAYRLQFGDTLMLHRDIVAKLRALCGAAGEQGRGSAVPAWLTPSRIRYSDGRIIAISKPAGVPVQGGTGIAEDTSVDACLSAIARLADSLPTSAAAAAATSQPSGKGRGRQQGERSAEPLRSGPRDDGRLRLVHRLDRDVSGLLLLGRGRYAAHALTSAFREGTIRKTYLAVVGAPLPPGVPLQGVISSPVVDAEYAPSSKGGKLLTKRAEEAETRYTAHVLALPTSSGGDATGTPAAPGAGASVSATAAGQPSAKGAAGTITLLYLEPVTGRKHQLRQHAMHLFSGRAGILGDSRYHPRMPEEMRRALGLPKAAASASGNSSRTAQAAADKSGRTAGVAGQAASLMRSPRPPSAGIALHSLKAVIPAGAFGVDQPPKDMLIKDSDGLPRWISGLLLERGWQLH